MEKTVKVSVIIGVYNPKKDKLFQAIQSIIHQTVKSWEMILYDDGSCIECAEIVKQASELDPRIIWVRNEENKGLAYALNRCLKLASGEYIARMDDDDSCSPQRFEKQIDFLNRHPEYSWVGSNAQLFDDNGVWGETTVPERPDRTDFLRFSPYIHPSVMFRREVFSHGHGYISSKITKRCEDYELFMRLHMQGYRGYNIQENLFQYREDQGAYAKRKFQYRYNEMKIRYRGFKRLGILRTKTLPYVFRPVVGGLVPVGLVSYMLRRNQNGNSGRYENRQISEVQKAAEKGEDLLP